MVIVLTTRPADAVKKNIQLYDIRRNQSRHVSDICQKKYEHCGFRGGFLEKFVYETYFLTPWNENSSQHTFEQITKYRLSLCEVWSNEQLQITMVADLCQVVLSCFRGEKAPRENPPNGDFFVFSHGDLSPRHTKVRHFSCVAFSPPVCRIFAWRGERSPRENPPKPPFGVFSPGDISPRMAKIRQTGAKTRKVATRKPAKWWLFRVFAWRPFAPPHKSTRHSMRCVFGYCLSYLCLARRKVAMRKPDKITFWRVFAWRPFASAPKTRLYDIA